MIRGIMAAHLNQAELFTKTILLNDRKVGALAPLCQSSYMITGNRLVHMALELQSDVSNVQTKAHDLELLRQWLGLFRNLQLSGLDALPSLIDPDVHVADKLVLVSRECALVWLPRQYGLYLHRMGKLYRVQPLVKPHHVFATDFLPSLDFYSFTPENDDLVLVLQPTFVDAFHASELEQAFSANTQLPIMMTQLTQRARIYGIKTDDAWLGMQVQRIEASILNDKRKVALAELAPAGNGKVVALSSQITPSLVVPLVSGNVLVVPFEERGADGKRKGTHGKRPTTIPRSQKTTATQRQVKPDARRSGAFSPDYAAYEEKGRKVPQWWLKLLHLDVKQLAESSWYKLKTLRQQPRHLQIAFGVTLTLLVAFIVTIGVMLFRPRNTVAPDSVIKVVVATPTPAVTIPQVTVLSRKIEVKAQSLAIKRFADAGADLVAMVQRGDYVIQLTEPAQGWVYVKLADGRTGYAFAQYLLPEPTPTATK